MMYILDLVPPSLTVDVWSDIMRSITGFVNRLYICLTALLVSSTVVSNGASGKLGVQVASAQYLLGLGELPTESRLGTLATDIVGQASRILLGRYMIYD